MVRSERQESVVACKSFQVSSFRKESCFLFCSVLFLHTCVCYALMCENLISL